MNVTGKIYLIFYMENIMRKIFIIFFLLSTTILTAKKLEFYQEFPEKYEKIKNGIFAKAQDPLYKIGGMHAKHFFKKTLPNKIGFKSVLKIAKEYSNKYKPKPVVNSYDYELNRINIQGLSYYGIKEKKVKKDYFYDWIGLVIAIIFIIVLPAIFIRLKKKKGKNS